MEITSNRIRQFCKRFERLLKSRPKGQVCNMADTGVSPECKTPGCHGGWMSILFKKGDYFEEGADALAKYLFRTDFANSSSLRDWASQNSDVWGNHYGSSMFSENGLAFNQQSSSFPAIVLLRHWKKVAKRLSLYEAMKRIK